MQPESPQSSSDGDFEDKPKATRKRKRSFTKTLNHDIEDDNNDTDDNAPSSNNVPGTTSSSDQSLRWEQLPPDIQSVLPQDEEYSYVIQSHQTLDTQAFEGAPEFAFSATIRINLETPEAIDTWLKKMMDTSLCTYRVTRGGHKPVGKRVLCRHEMHCQHNRKPLTPKQIQLSANAKAKQQRKPLCTRVREKKTQCPSTLTLSLQVPTKKQNRAAEEHPYLVSHKAVLRLEFAHNHPIHSAHSLSFRPVSESTKQHFFSFLRKDTVHHLLGTPMNKCCCLTQKQMLRNKQR